MPLAGDNPSLHHNTDLAVTSHTVGAVLGAGEKPWGQIPARCSLDRPPATPTRCCRRSRTGSSSATASWTAQQTYTTGRTWPGRATCGCSTRYSPGRRSPTDCRLQTGQPVDDDEVRQQIDTKRVMLENRPSIYDRSPLYCEGTT